MRYSLCQAQIRLHSLPLLSFLTSINVRGLQTKTRKLICMEHFLALMSTVFSAPHRELFPVEKFWLKSTEEHCFEKELAKSKWVKASLTTSTSWSMFGANKLYQQRSWSYLIRKEINTKYIRDVRRLLKGRIFRIIRTTSIKELMKTMMNEADKYTKKAVEKSEVRA